MKSYIDRCDCGEYKAKEEREREIKYQEKISKATEIELEDIKNDSEIWFYDEQTDDYFSDLDSFVDSCKDFDEYESKEEMLNNIPEVLWLCDTVDISMDAGSIIADVCEELYEDKKELQNMLDRWCKKQTGTRTVYPNYKKYVRVRKEWFV